MSGRNFRKSLKTIGTRTCQLARKPFLLKPSSNRFSWASDRRSRLRKNSTATTLTANTASTVYVPTTAILVETQNGSILARLRKKVSTKRMTASVPSEKRICSPDIITGNGQVNKTRIEEAVHKESKSFHQIDEQNETADIFMA